MDNQTNDGKGFSRRDLLKGFATLPALGAFGYGMFRKWNAERLRQSSIAQELGLNFDEHPAVAPTKSDGKTIRVGIIGYGIRGEQLMRAAGFARPELIDDWKRGAAANANDRRYAEYQEQEDLNIVITAVCDLFDVHAENALAAAANTGRNGVDGEMKLSAKRYRRYTELINADDVDAVIIATPDHWHARMVVDAAKAGKHVYVEKGLTRTVEEAFDVRRAVKESGIIMQLGHQGRQTASYNKAKEIIDKNILGKITLIEVCTNRNDPNGAWVYDIHPKGSPETIDWEQFTEPTDSHPFSLERFFRWRCWWDYGTGLSGDLLTHEYDALNQVLKLGIPHSAVASGGVYFYKDGREVPDVFQSVMEYPDRDLTFLYSASLASERFRGKVIMGHDASMEMENSLTVTPDSRSTRYREQLQSGVVSSDKPMITYVPGKSNVDAVTSATEQYFASRGLLYTYVQGKRVDTTHLHIREWLNCIRSGEQPSCNIDQAFEEAVTAHMATIALRENRKVFWDAENEKIV
ncbi:Gfo/Idh/MocA family protein [Mangrovibacterium diazotrophicum]|uniref:Putative dehydrogenase n=1 Tax=Mangrovibacterium diazotrophicum TaxID=1261403 RepID=A0A419VY63_9BACT|nr:Gfo/Idh/MocA family oxidoreductase [Mangrovibacterium diazotrophicum]RKD88165.1 putative dehydrogenase [Mangrovibacterium diazotrophicum]